MGNQMLRGTCAGGHPRLWHLLCVLARLSSLVQMSLYLTYDGMRLVKIFSVLLQW